jgi:hypothetical protein
MSVRSILSVGIAELALCEDCPPVGYPTDDTRCEPCPRRTVPYRSLGDYRAAAGSHGRPNMAPPYACDGCGDLGWEQVGETARMEWPVWDVCTACGNPNDEPRP